MSGSSHHLHPPSDEDSALGSLPPDDDDCRRRRPLANINPFTPDGNTHRPMTYIKYLLTRCNATLVVNRSSAE